MRIILLCAVLGCFSVAPLSAGETRADRLGITVDSANRNADRVRRAQNRESSYINEINQSGSDCCRN